VTGTFFASGGSFAMADLAIGKVSKPSSEPRAQKSQDRVIEPRSGLSCFISWPEIVFDVFVSVSGKVFRRFLFRSSGEIRFAIFGK
jgi:hypothetical protein